MNRHAKPQLAYYYESYNIYQEDYIKYGLNYDYRAFRYHYDVYLWYLNALYADNISEYLDGSMPEFSDYNK